MVLKVVLVSLVGDSVVLLLPVVMLNVIVVLLLAVVLLTDVALEILLVSLVDVSVVLLLIVVPDVGAGVGVGSADNGNHAVAVCREIGVG
jgi:hypothetical protein